MRVQNPIGQKNYISSHIRKFVWLKSYCFNIRSVEIIENKSFPKTHRLISMGFIYKINLYENNR